MARRFEMKYPLTRVDIRKVGSYEKLKRILKEKGLLVEVVETASKGGGGTVWVIEKKNDPTQYISISTYSRKVRSRKDGRTYYFYRYFLVEADKLNQFLQIFQ